MRRQLYVPPLPSFSSDVVLQGQEAVVLRGPEHLGFAAPPPELLSPPGVGAPRARSFPFFLRIFSGLSIFSFSSSSRPFPPALPLPLLALAALLLLALAPVLALAPLLLAPLPLVPWCVTSPLGFFSVY